MTLVLFYFFILELCVLRITLEEVLQTMKFVLVIRFSKTMIYKVAFESEAMRSRTG